MSGSIPIPRNRAQLPFQPAEAKKKLSVTKAAVKYATEMRDWEKLHIAIDEMIDIQKQFVGWWNQYVSVRESPGRGGYKSVSELKPISAEQAKTATGISKVQVSRWTGRLDDATAYHANLFQYEYRKAMATLSSELVQQSLSNEHYTPSKYIEAARNVLGEIDLDPASCEEANRIVKATEYFDEKSNGLECNWQGRIWLNPPYGGLAGKFIGKLTNEFEAGNIEASIVLVSAHCTDTAWFQKLWSGLLCFTDHRINFYGDGGRSGSTHGSVFIYFGPSGAAFIEHFRCFGQIVKAV